MHLSKAKVAIEAIKEQTSLQELAAKFELHPTQISSWKREFLKNTDLAFGSKSEKEDSDSETGPPKENGISKFLLICFTKSNEEPQFHRNKHIGINFSIRSNYSMIFNTFMLNNVKVKMDKSTVFIRILERKTDS